jgi:ABC-type transport system involved in multi-copper enzyme maturation permease subunit
MFIMCAAVMWLVMLAQALLTLGISLLVFDYQPGAFTAKDFGYLMASLAFEMLDYLCVAALVTMLCAMFKKAGLSAVLYVAVMFLLTLVGAILSVVLLVMKMEPGNGSTIDVLEFFQRINIFQANAVIGTGSSYSREDVLYYVLPPVIYTAGLLGFGVWRFNKKDLK